MHQHFETSHIRPASRSRAAPPRGAMTRPELPNNPEAERALLGPILIAACVRADVPGLLSPTDLYLERHQWIYRAQLDLQKGGRPVDLVTLADALDRAGRLGESPDQVSAAYPL